MTDVYPLEITDQETYGNLDQNQLELITPKPQGLGAYDLVLIENASQLFSNVILSKDNIENIIKLIIKNSKSSKCTSIGSLSVPYYISQKTLDAYPHADVKESDMTSQAKEKYHYTIQNYVKIQKKECIITILSLDFGEEGGHYAAYIYSLDSKNRKKLLIFDSMSKVNQPSAYAPFFIQLGQDIFGVDADILVPCVQNIISLQYTGGFLNNNPFHVEEAVKEGKIDEETAYNLSVQSTDSQNHFCWLWSIWYIHLYLNGITLDQALKQMNKNHLNPLIVIKRYAWSLLNLTGLINDVNHLTFFRTFFPRIWMAPDPLSLDFKPLQISFPPSKNYNDALTNSFSPAELKPVPLTPVPQPLLRAIKVVKGEN